MNHPLPFDCRVSLLEGENGPAHFPPSLFHCVSITCNSYLAILWATMHIVDDCYITLVHILVDVLNNCIGPIQWNTHRSHEQTCLIGFVEGGRLRPPRREWLQCKSQFSFQHNAIANECSGFPCQPTETINSAGIVYELNNIRDHVQRMDFETVSYLLAQWLGEGPKREGSGPPEGALPRDNIIRFVMISEYGNHLPRDLTIHILFLGF